MFSLKLLKASTGITSRHIVSSNIKNSGVTSQCRNFSCTSANAVREVKRFEEGDKIVVEGVYAEEPKNPTLPKKEGCDEACPICPLRLGVEVKYTDVLILSQFLRSDGGLLPRYATGVCPKGQRRLGTLVNYAQKAGLMPELRPDLPGGRDETKLKSSYKWRKNNIYYGEYGEVH